MPIFFVDFIQLYSLFNKRGGGVGSCWGFGGVRVVRGGRGKGGRWSAVARRGSLASVRKNAHIWVFVGSWE